MVATASTSSSRLALIDPAMTGIPALMMPAGGVTPPTGAGSLRNASSAGRITARRTESARSWSRPVWLHCSRRPTTQDVVRQNLTNHDFPVIGDRPLDSLRNSDMTALVKRLGGQARTGDRVGDVPVTIMKAAVVDRKIASSPCAGVRVPKPRTTKVTPLPPGFVRALADSMPDRYRALVLFTAATGLRQSEAFGVTVDRIDFLRRRLTVDRQMLSVSGKKPEFAPLKTGASHRDIPLPQFAVNAVAEHLAKYPAGVSGHLHLAGRVAAAPVSV